MSSFLFWILSNWHWFFIGYIVLSVIKSLFKKKKSSKLQKSVPFPLDPSLNRSSHTTKSSAGMMEYKLLYCKDGNLKFVPTLYAKMFYLGIMLVGGVLLIPVYRVLFCNADKMFLIFLLFGTFLLMLGCYYFYMLFSRQIIFDIQLSKLIIKDIPFNSNTSKSREFDFKNFDAFKIIPVFEQGRYDEFDQNGYELHLILTDREILYLNGHSSLKHIRNEAIMLSKKLNVILYDETEDSAGTSPMAP
jgi:hypothetical protein